MPSPFPGMDPYLENPATWRDLHHRLINHGSDYIMEQVRPRYYVKIEERVYVADADDTSRSNIAPDLTVVAGDPYERRRIGPGRGAVGVGVIEPVVATNLVRDEVREARLEIIDRKGRRVVTVLEFLSPANKRPGSNGHASFEQKRQDVLNSASHWVEIDLLRAGVGVRTKEPLPPHDYLAHVSRVEQRPQGTVWPIRLPQRLPIVPIPLKPEDPDAELDLQEVLNTAYDRAGYDYSVDYEREPVPPLAPEWAEMADGWLKAKGLRAG